MNLKLLNSLVYSLLLLNKLELKNLNEVSVFTKSQITKMPDYFYFSVVLISIFFEVIILFIHFKRFHKLNDIKKVRVISIIKENNIPVLSLFIRLCESNVLVKYFDLNNE